MSINCKANKPLSYNMLRRGKRRKMRKEIKLASPRKLALFERNPLF